MFCHLCGESMMVDTRPAPPESRICPPCKRDRVAARLRDENAALRERVAVLERSMAKVVAHTGYMPHASVGLLSGLLDSCRRIAESALAAAKPDA